MKRPLIAAAVVLAHALAIFGVLYRAPTPQRDPIVRAHTLAPDFDFIDKAIAGNGFSDCPAFYWGYGFKTGWGASRVTEVAKGYAADRAGLLVGDYVRDLILGPSSGPGIVETFVVERAGSVVSLRMVSEKICQRT